MKNCGLPNLRKTSKMHKQPIECTVCFAIMWKKELPNHETGKLNTPGYAFYTLPNCQDEIVACPTCKTSLDNDCWQYTFAECEVGAITIHADLFGLKIHESNQQENFIQITTDEVSKILHFMEQWKPVLEAVSYPRCPNPDHLDNLTCPQDHAIILRPVEYGRPDNWHCVDCQNDYASGNFGEELTLIYQDGYGEVKSEVADFDPFLDEYELP